MLYEWIEKQISFDCIYCEISLRLRDIYNHNFDSKIQCLFPNPINIIHH